MARFSMPSAITDRPSCLLRPMVELTIAASSELASRSEHERPVDLEPVEREFLQIAQARIAGAEIVEHDADAELLDPAGTCRAPSPRRAAGCPRSPRVRAATGSSPVASSTSATDCARSPDWSCDGERLTPTRTPCPARSHARACRAGGLQHPVCDPLRDRRGVDDRHELPRRNQAAHRDGASGSALRRRSGCRRPDGPAADRTTRIRCARRPAPVRLPASGGSRVRCRIASLEHHVTAAPGRLGAAQRQMAVAQEFVRGAAAFRDRPPRRC